MHPHHDSELISWYHDAFLPWDHYLNNIVLFYHDSPITRSHFMDPTDRAIKGFYCMYDLVKAYRNMQKSIANQWVEDWEASNGRTKETTWLFHDPWDDPVGKHICVQPFRIWNRPGFHPLFCRYHKYSRNLVALAWTADELSHGQTPNG